MTGWLEQDQALPKREQRTAMRLFEDLQQEGYTGAYDSVVRFVRAHRQDLGKTTDEPHLVSHFRQFAVCQSYTSQLRSEAIAYGSAGLMGTLPDSPRVSLARIIGSVIVGTLLLGAGAAACWWGLSAERAAAGVLDRLSESHVAASPDDGPLTENDGRTLYLSGPVTVSEPLHDKAAGLRLEALVLRSQPQKLVHVKERAGENDSRVIRSLVWQGSQVEGLESARRYPQEVRIGRFVIPDQQLDFLLDIPPITCDELCLRKPVLQYRTMDCGEDGWFPWPLALGDTNAGGRRCVYA